MEDQTAQYQRPHRMQMVLERGDHTEVPTTTAESPEQLLVLRRAGRTQLPIGADDIDRQEVVTSEAEATHEVPQAAAEGEARDARRRDDAAGRGQAERLGLVVELAPGHSGLGANRAPRGIDPDSLQPGQVDHQTAVAHTMASDAVATPPDRHGQVVRPCEI